MGVMLAPSGACAILLKLPLGLLALPLSILSLFSLSLVHAM